MFWVKPVTFAVTTPAAVVPVADKPVAPLPAAPEVRTSHWYPPLGGEAAAVHETVAEVAVIAEEISVVGKLPQTSHAPE